MSDQGSAYGYGGLAPVGVGLWPWPLSGSTQICPDLTASTLLLPLRVTLDPQRLHLRPWPPPAGTPQPRVFFVLGNEKVPQVSGRTGARRGGTASGVTERGGIHYIINLRIYAFPLLCSHLPSNILVTVITGTGMLNQFEQVWGIGLLNIFMCQFPFDLDAGVETKVLAVLAGYDYVLLNSQFSYQV